jgi:MSHA pilin protein MshD
MSSNRKLRQRGVTLIELILFILIVSIAVLAILGVMSLTTKNSADPLRRKQAQMIAEGLLEEVQLARFTYCEPSAENADTAADAAACANGMAEAWGPENGAGRPFDNVNDYVSAANTPASAFGSGAVLDAEGNSMGLEGYTARVTVTALALGGSGAPGASANAEVLRIRVEVSYGTESVVLDGFRARYAPNFL